MSRDFLNITVDKFIKIFSVDTKKTETLAEYVKRIRNEKGLSTTKVEEISRRGGAKGVSNAYVSQIENNYIQNVSPDKLKSLAKGLGVSEEEIFAVARGSNPDKIAVANERFVFISYGYSALSDDERRTIEPFLEAIESVIKRSPNYQEFEKEQSELPHSQNEKHKGIRYRARKMASEFFGEENKQDLLGSEDSDIIEHENLPLAARNLSKEAINNSKFQKFELNPKNKDSKLPDNSSSDDTDIIELEPAVLHSVESTNEGDKEPIKVQGIKLQPQNKEEKLEDTARINRLIVEPPKTENRKS